MVLINTFNGSFLDLRTQGGQKASPVGIFERIRKILKMLFYRVNKYERTDTFCDIISIHKLNYD